MPSLRKPLSIRQKLIAVYTDPNVFALADCVARVAFNAPLGHRDYRRHVTCFLLDLEARIHTNRQKTERHLRDQETWNLRRDLALDTTGRDMLLAQPPSADTVRKWRNRFLPPGPLGTSLPAPLAAFITEYESLAMARAKQLGQFPLKKKRKLANLKARHTCMADGTYVRTWSQVEAVPDPLAKDNTLFLGSRGKNPRRDGDRVTGARVQEHVHRPDKNGRETMGVNHVAIITRSRYGRVVLGVERALGGEVHAALTAMDRIAPLAQGAIHALAYDKALTGWQIDYLLARQGIVAVAPPRAARDTAESYEVADQLAEEILAGKHAASTPAHITARMLRPHAKKNKKKAANGSGDAHTKRFKTAVARRLLGELYDLDQLVADAAAGRPLGAGLPLGTSVYLNSHNGIVPVDSVPQYFDTHHHQVGPSTCSHELYVDDGALWDTVGGYRGRVKDQRLTAVEAHTEVDEDTGWHVLHSTYRLVCTHTGEVRTVPVTLKASGAWTPDTDLPKRSARQNMMLLARCDSRWRKIYGLRNDCESWFSWLKQQLLDDKRAASLDLNHQLLDVLYAGVITNAIALFNYHREHDC